MCHVLCRHVIIAIKQDDSISVLLGHIGHLSLVHLRSVEVWDRASLGNAYWDVFFSENVSDPVIESFRDVRDLKI